MIRISLAHPQSFFLKLIEPVIEQRADMCVVGKSTCLHSILNPLSDSEVLLLSSDYPKTNLFPFIKARSMQLPKLKILMLGMDTNVDQIVQFIELGAYGYILQDETTDVMLEKIVASYVEKPLLDSDVIRALLYRVQTTMCHNEQLFDAHNANSKKRLTSRELEVLHLVREQLSNREIAQRLFIEEGTVKNHVHRILKKLNVSSRYEAIGYLKLNNTLS